MALQSANSGVPPEIKAGSVEVVDRQGNRYAAPITALKRIK